MLTHGRTDRHEVGNSYLDENDILHLSCRSQSNISDILNLFEISVKAMVDDWRSEPKVQPLFYGLLGLFHLSGIQKIFSTYGY